MKMVHRYLVHRYFLALALLLTSCGENQVRQKDKSDSVSRAENTSTSVPGIEKLSFTDTLLLAAGEDMHFDKELFRVKAGKKLHIILRNIAHKSPMAMTHNVVVLVPGTDLADFAELARNAKAEQYVPSAVVSLIVAHTKLVSGGESDEVAFTIPQPGVYDFICSYPGHWGTMQGKIVAE